MGGMWDFPVRVFSLKLGHGMAVNFTSPCGDLTTVEDEQFERGEIVGGLGQDTSQA